MAAKPSSTPPSRKNIALLAIAGACVLGTAAVLYSQMNDGPPDESPLATGVAPELTHGGEEAGMEGSEEPDDAPEWEEPPFEKIGRGGFALPHEDESDLLDEPRDEAPR